MAGGKDKAVIWVGSSKKDLMALPTEVRKFFGHALDFAQRGDRHDAAKPLHGFGGAGVLEIVEDNTGGTYRAVYTVKFADAVFVLHCFQKKSKSGIAHPKRRCFRHPRAAQSCRNLGKGKASWQSVVPRVSR